MQDFINGKMKMMSKKKFSEWLDDFKIRYRLKLLIWLKITKADWAVNTPFVHGEDMFIYIRDGYKEDTVELCFGKMGANHYCTYYENNRQNITGHSQYIYENEEIENEFMPIFRKIEPKEIRILIDKKYRSRKSMDVVRLLQEEVTNYDGTVSADFKENLAF